ncbi:hypothetical protein LRP30_37605 [Bradyrhizobium sp. C-145]|uniref:hypothetical protein n=1 Tax=Bradyrhizobium sp. C-145 TaxID=574727 RepID=UPI00201B6542|nr:hypothetical protein [Bradyrhizobium sp. C-145]UQR62410.1 hypothetical protein LRP30_37605 [Bradyrhizobium sp. C-145]
MPGLTKRERSFITPLNILSREVASSNPETILLSSGSLLRLAASAPITDRCQQRMSATNFDKRKVSPLNIEFIGVTSRTDTQLARIALRYRVEASLAPLTGVT